MSGGRGCGTALIDPRMLLPQTLWQRQQGQKLDLQMCTSVAHLCHVQTLITGCTSICIPYRQLEAQYESLRWADFLKARIRPQNVWQWPGCWAESEVLGFGSKRLSFSNSLQEEVTDRIRKFAENCERLQVDCPESPPCPTVVFHPFFKFTISVRRTHGLQLERHWRLRSTSAGNLLRNKSHFSKNCGREK